MAILLAITGWETADWESRLRRLAPGRDIRVYPDHGSASGIDYALCWKAPHGLLAALPDLKVIFSLGAGVDHLMEDPSLPEVPLVRIVDPSLTRRMTEWVVLQVLSHHRLQRQYRHQQERKVWNGLDEPMAGDVSVGIMGLGVLGRDAAEKLAALGFDVAGWSRSAREVPGVSCFHGDEGLERFLARSDILVCLLPLTRDTEGILDYSLFARLKRSNHMGGPVLINAGRGALQVEDDIVRALEDGTLAGAALDVFRTEPLPADSPLWNAPGITITPHSSAESDPDYLCAYVLRQIERHERGEALENVVDRTRGY